MENQLKEMKINLVKAVRMLENIDLLDMNGHVSCRLPEGDAFLINSRQGSRVSISVHDIVICNLDGKPINDIEPPSEVQIHSNIYKVRPDVFAVIHNHPHWQTVLGIAGFIPKPVFSIGSMTNEMEIYENSSLVNIREMGEEVAEALKGNMAIHLRHHGSVVVGHDLKSVFYRAVVMEENAKKQYQAAVINPNHYVLKGESLARTQKTNWGQSIIEKMWSYYESKSLREGIFENIE